VKFRQSAIIEPKGRYEAALRGKVLAKAGSERDPLDELFEAYEKDAGVVGDVLTGLTQTFGPYWGATAGLSALGSGMWAYNRTADGSSQKVLDEAIKQRQRQLQLGTPRPFMVRPVPISKPEIDSDPDTDEDPQTAEDRRAREGRLGVPAANDLG
jgi:hypothetical protein